MEFNVEELGTTLAVGAYVIFGAELLLLAFFGSNVYRLINASERLGPWGARSLVVVACFAIGMIAEDLSNKFVDDFDFWQKLKILPAEKELRSNSLFGRNPTKKISGLAREAAKNKLLSAYGGKQGKEIEQLINSGKLDSSHLINQRNYSNVANRLYYHAKNAIFLEDNYFEEMHRIQVRIDFARSFAIISIVLIMTTLTLYLIKLVFPNLRLSHFPGIKSENQDEHVKNVSVKAEVGKENNNDEAPKSEQVTYFEKAVGWIIILSIFYIIGRSAYAAEEKEFNLRVYGYFSTLHVIGKLSTSRLPVVSGMVPGISGMAFVNKRVFIVIHDYKKNDPSPRVNLLKLQENGQVGLHTLSMNWEGIKPRANDLESICALGKDNDEFLIAESGYKDNEFGRIFRVHIQKHNNDWQGKVEHVYRLPKDTVNIEGMVCHQDADKTIRLVLGERGGSKEYPVGTLREATIEYGIDQVVVSRSIAVERQSGTIKSDGHVRDISALYVDGDNILWTVRTTDAGDAGPFSSWIYPVAKWQSASGKIEDISPDYKKVTSEIQGLKVEALTKPTIPGSRFSIATDDENYGAIWRPIW